MQRQGQVFLPFGGGLLLFRPPGQLLPAGQQGLVPQVGARAYSGISTLAGQQSKWVEEGLIDRVKEVTDLPVEHYEARGAAEQRATSNDSTEVPA